MSDMDEKVLWTLNGLSAGQKSRRTCKRLLDPHHLEALEEAGYIHVRIARNGEFTFHVLPDGHEAAQRFRLESVAAYTQPKVKY
jgi:hypothetical protein